MGHCSTDVKAPEERSRLCSRQSTRLDPNRLFVATDERKPAVGNADEPLFRIDAAQCGWMEPA